jgi:hypothetical protein
VIELIAGLPDRVVAFEAVGDVTARDYDEVVAPVFERALASHAKIRLLHVIGDRFTGHSASALVVDAKLGLANVRSIERVAVVTDIKRFRAIARTIPGDVRLFSNAERAAAEAWIGEGLPPA